MKSLLRRVGFVACACLFSGGLAGVAAAADAPGPCGGLTAADAAAILQIPAADVTGPQHLETFTCIYRSQKDYYKSLTFNVYVEKSAAEASKKLDALKEGLADLSPAVAVKNLGDEAWRFPDSRVLRLLMREGNVRLDVVTPGDGTSQEKIAEIVLRHIPKAE
jgi:hypothetical protein